MDKLEPDNQPHDITFLRTRLQTLRHSVDEMEDLLDRYIDSEQALRESEERFRLIVEGVKDYAIFMLDVTGQIMSWNLGAQAIKGYRADEIIGRHFSIFYPPEEIAAGKPARELVIARAEGRYTEEGWRIRKDGTRFWANVLITALYDLSGELRGFGKVTRDMTDRKQAEEEREQLRERERQLILAREARAQVEATLRSRDEFLTAMAHELRTPMTSLLGHAQLLERRMKQNQLTAANIQRPISAVIEQAQRLNRLTTMLLDMTRLEHEKLEIRRSDIDLRVVIRQVVDLFPWLAERYMLEVTLPPEPVIVVGDDLRLDQIIYNLIENAIKYSAAGSRITIDLQPVETHALMTITDQVGIPLQDLPHVFNRFYRATNIATEHISGMGIGLYIVNELVAMHGGTIDVRSEPGQGSTFVVRLPLSTL